VKYLSTLEERKQHKATRRALWIGSSILLAVGISGVESSTELLAYLLVVVAALAPTVLWFWNRRVGVPILPAVATLHILYYAIPIARGRADLSDYSSDDIFRAAATVSLFLAMAAFATFVLLRDVRPHTRVRKDLISGLQMKTLVFLGLGFGIVFLGALTANLLSWLGLFFGLARSVALTALVVACYFLGVARGQGILRGRTWFWASAGMTVAILISWSSLFLVYGLTFLLAAGAGYVSTRGRIPWLMVGVATILVSILHAGKEEMRSRSWKQDQGAAQTSLLRLPRLAVDWFGAGVKSIATTPKGRSAIDRASLLQILMRVQFLTPSYLDYMRGDTYALLPGMLIPRFLVPNKTRSQAGMDMLSIRYGILSAEGAEKTSIGWGLVAEAYANFGFFGVGGIGLLLGIASGALARWSARGSTVSVSTLMAVAVMVGFINLEQDLSGLVTSVLQSVAAVFVFVALLRLFSKRNRRPTEKLPMNGGVSPHLSSSALSGMQPRS
jgi:hypothetical protein